MLKKEGIMETNQGFKDVILSEYITADLITNYKLFDLYIFNFSAKNILDKEYSRPMNIKLLKIF